MSERKLASVQRIHMLEPIAGKDRILLAGVLGWRVIVRKGDFAAGDLCVYCEPDSVMPERPEFEFLRDKKFRIRTMRMAGVVSEGICFPLDVLPPDIRAKVHEGDDVTAELGVTKYDPPVDDGVAEAVTPQRKKKSWLMRFAWYRRTFGKTKREKAGFPDFISHTDECRIQVIPEALDDKKHKYVVTEKIDGCSGSYVLVRHEHKLRRDSFEYIVCSRNLRLSRDNSIYWQVSDKYQIEAVLKNLIGKRDWICIQGECIGPKIQGNKYKVTEPALYVFNLITSDAGRYGSVKAKNILAPFDIPFVPILDENFHLPDTVEEMLTMAGGQSAIGDTLREGFVVRSADGKKSFKAVSPEFLIKYYGEGCADGEERN